MSMKSVVYLAGGYVGITGSIHMAKAGVHTIIYDTNQSVVDNINAGTPKSGEFLSYLDSDVADLVSKGMLKATTNWNQVKDNDVFIIAVPSERDGEPYDDIVVKAAIKIVYDCYSSGIKPTIIIESTLSPGTTDKIMDRALDRNCIVGKDYYLAVCPRKDWFADPEKNLSTLPRVVGGVTDACSEKAYAVLTTVSREIHITQYDTAELTKALENAFLHTSTMFAHEVALARPDLDVAEAVRLAGLHWRIPNYHLGFGAGGRCIPLGTKYITRATEGHTGRIKIGEQATTTDVIIRESIATVAQRAWNRTNKTGAVLILGLGYRPDFKDTGLSPGLAIAKILESRGVPVFVHDPLFTPEEVKENFGLHMCELEDTVFASITHKNMLCDLISVVLLATPHTAYINMPLNYQMSSVEFILDAQGAWKQYQTKFEDYGIEYHQVGDRNWTMLLA